MRSKLRAELFALIPELRKPRRGCHMRLVLRLILISLVGATMSADAQNATIKPGENFVVDGIPPIPASGRGRPGREPELRGGLNRGWRSARTVVSVSTRVAWSGPVHLGKFSRA